MAKCNSRQGIVCYARLSCLGPACQTPKGAPPMAVQNCRWLQLML